MNIRRYRQFIAVAEEKQFGRAAQRLNMAQPPLSQAIINLEKELGVQLFVRSNRSVELTQAGQAFLTEIRGALEQIEKAETAARQTARGMRGTLRISFNLSTAFNPMPGILREFRKKHPNVELDLRVLITAEQVEMIMEDRVDVGFIRKTTFDKEDVVFVPLWRDRILIAMPEDHPLIKQRQISLHQLKNEPFILRRISSNQYFLGPNFNARLLSACQEAGFTPKVVQEANQWQAVTSLVAAGIGVSPVAASLSNIRWPGVVYKKLRDRSPHLHQDFGIAWKTGNPSPILPSFLKLVQKLVRTERTLQGAIYPEPDR